MIVLTIDVMLTFSVVMMARINVVSPTANIIPLQMMPQQKVPALENVLPSSVPMNGQSSEARKQILQPSKKFIRQGEVLILLVMQVPQAQKTIKPAKHALANAITRGLSVLQFLKSVLLVQSALIHLVNSAPLEVKVIPAKVMAIAMSCCELGTLPSNTYCTTTRKIGPVQMMVCTIPRGKQNWTVVSTNIWATMIMFLTMMSFTSRTTSNETLFLAQSTMDTSMIIKPCSIEVSIGCRLCSLAYRYPVTNVTHDSTIKKQDTNLFFGMLVPSCFAASAISLLRGKGVGEELGLDSGLKLDDLGCSSMMRWRQRQLLINQ